MDWNICGQLPTSTRVAAKDFISRAHKDGKPFFVWANTTHMHFRTHAKPTSLGQSGRWQSEYHDVMIDHDKTVGDLLGLLDELGIAEDTIVLYSTDNGPHRNSWPALARRLSEVRKTRTGRGPSVCQLSCGGPARSRRAQSPIN